jgi:hypothetical protein
MSHNNTTDDDEEGPDPAEGWSEPVGAPDGFWNRVERNEQVDNRLPERHSRSESRPERHTESTEVPLKKVGAPGVTSTQLAKYGITMDEARFMRAVVKAMNRDLQGYDLTESMVGIKDHYDIDEEKLVQAGYLKRHAGVDNRAYFTVTFDGQDACGIQKEQGREVGDIGADTPHRVGIDLAREYYESLPYVRRVELAVRENGRKADLLVIDENETRIAIIEVEGGRVDADPYISDEDRTGLMGYESVRNDYRLLAESDGESVWVVRNYDIAGDVLQILSSGDDISFELPKEVIQSVKDRTMRIRDLNDDHIDPLQDAGISEVVTFRQLRNALKEMDGSSG